jgi:alpha-D-ribose 1-methylphosphonate 5-phosphate C-P lyase
MTKAIKKIRKTCLFCGTKRYLKNMYFANYKNGGQYACKNNDLCVLKMSFNKKKKNICEKH